MTDYEVDELVRTLQSHGALTRAALLEYSGARLWAAGTFEYALRRGTAAGSIRELEADLFEVGDDAPDLSEGKFDPA
ncbi:MAG TPA: hypothetical protein VGI67_02090 [Thermoleophilaceae bacterium]